MKLRKKATYNAMDPLKQEFVNLMNVMGWTQAETARQLCMTSGAVNQLVNPNLTVKPSTTTLALFKLLVATQRPDAMNAKTMQLKENPGAHMSAAERKLVEALRQVSAAELPRAYAALHGLIKGFAAPLRVRRGYKGSAKAVKR
ncbi:MAG: hypothetical protein ABSF38_08725 [Verrucomicrobiota bacterium]|jgi:hypothetical protein